MGITELLQMVSTVGFPVVMAIIIYVNNNKQAEMSRSELLSLNKDILTTINDNTKALTSLESYIKDGNEERV